MATTTRTTKAASGTKKTSTATASKAAAKPAEKAPAASTGAKKTTVHLDEVPATVTRDEIALRAYQIWQQRGAQHGSHEQDWLEAERQLLAR